MRALRVYGTLFLVTGVPFGVIMGLSLAAVYGLFLGDAGGGFVSGLALGALFGALMSAILGTAQLLGTRGTPPGESLRPRQERQVPVAAGPELGDRVVAALRALPAELTAVDVPAGRYSARTSWSWKSFGEDVVVQLSGDPAAPVALVSSVPVVRTTLVDYGKGRRNVEHVVRALTAVG